MKLHAVKSSGIYLPPLGPRTHTWHCQKNPQKLTSKRSFVIQLLLVLHSQMSLKVQVARQVQVAVTIAAEEWSFLRMRHLLMTFQMMIVSESTWTLVALER